jgi:hypothetical protein
MKRQLVFLHGRSQQFKDSKKLKAEWISAWKEGLDLSGLEPIDESRIHFPYYGQTLDDLVEKRENVADVIIRGVFGDPVEKAFYQSVLGEIQEVAGITEDELIEAGVGEVIERGPLNWPWVRAVLQVVDQKVPYGSSTSIALATKDVYQYLHNPVLRREIDSEVAKAIDPEVETVLVTHSLGTVVAYNILQSELAKNWKIPLFVTLGSPLAVSAIKKRLGVLRHPPSVGKWYNAMDPRDIVAIRPLDKAHFGINPEIENNTGINNNTENRHGIAGYLNNNEVAKRIHDALVK